MINAKQSLSAILLISLLASLAACGSESSGGNDDTTTAPVETTAPETETVVTTAMPLESTNTEPIVEKSGCTGFISVTSLTLVLLCLPVCLHRKKYES